MAVTPSAGAPPAALGPALNLRGRTDAQPALDDGVRNERGQACVRLGICCFMAIYFYAIGFSNHALFTGFSVYCLAYLAILGRARSFSRTRVVVALLLDNYFTVSGLFVTGNKGVFLYIFLIHITFGYGVRYGRTYLWLSVTAACGGVVTLYLAAPAWHGNVHSMIAYFFGVPFIALYIDYFVQRLRRAQRESDARATEISKLLAFVAHDIRTPLQSLLSTIEVARGASLEQHTRLRLGRMEQAVRLLARLATEVLTTARPPPAALSSPALATLAWFIGVVAIFRDEFARQRIHLRYDLDFTVAPFVHFDRLAAERLLLNALSNAARFAAGGDLTLALAQHERGGPVHHLEFRIVNRRTASPRAGERRPAYALREPSLLHGAGLGLVAARETAKRVLGEFRFERPDDRTHVSSFTIPVQIASATAAPGIALPVIVVGPGMAALDRVRAALAGMTHVLHFASPAFVARHERELRAHVAAVFITADAISAVSARQSTGDPGGSFGVHTLLVASADDHTALPGTLNALHDAAPAQAIVNAVYAQATLRDHGAELEPAASGGLPPQRILLIEDSMINAEVLAEGLRGVTASLTIARGAAEGRHWLSAGAFDVVLLDWHLGDGLGAEFLNDFVASGAVMPGLVILSSESADLIRAEIAGRIDCPVLQRPVGIERVVEAIAQVVRTEYLRTPTAAMCGSRAFDVEIYEAMRANGTTTERVLDLLERAEQEIEAAIARLRVLVAEPIDRDLRASLHGLKSIADAAGAYELGHATQRVMNAEREFRASASRVAALTPLETPWRLARRHVTVYRLYLESQDTRHKAARAGA